MKILFLVGIGGFLGAVARFLLNSWVQSKFLPAYPYGTFLVNIIGSFLIGVLFALLEKGALSQEVRTLLISGLLGGFTTFSSFSLEAVLFIREGQLLSAGLYTLGSVSAGVVACFLGLLLTKLM